MSYVEQKHKKDGIQVQFTEDENAAFYALKGGDDYFLCVKVKVHSLQENGKKKYIGSYFKEFDTTVTSISYNRFVKQFLEEPEYRKQYFSDGEQWIGTIPFRTEKGVNQKCLAQIQRINQRNSDKLKFKDFAAIKTYGMDGFSRMKYEKLVEIVDDKEVQDVKQAFTEEKHIVSSLRWIARGLKVHHAIRKVKTDLEIQSNM